MNKGLTTKENENFISVELYPQKISIKDIIEEKLSLHFSEDRLYRLENALKMNKLVNGQQANIHKVFLVNKGHKDGKELHCVSNNGIIFILNENKYNNHENSLITILIARPNQVKRLYAACNIKVPFSILECTKNNVALQMNK